MDVSPDASAGQAGPGVLPAAGGAAFPDSSSEDEFPSLPPQTRAPFVDEFRFGSPALDQPDLTAADVTSWFSPADADEPAAQRARTGPSPAAHGASTTTSWDLGRGLAAVRLQTAWRRVQARQRAKGLAHIRAGARMFQRVTELREAAILIQRCARRRQARLYSVSLARARAAIRVQGACRRRQAQRRATFLSRIGPVPRSRARARLWLSTHDLIRARLPSLATMARPLPADALTRRGNQI